MAMECTWMAMECKWMAMDYFYSRHPFTKYIHSISIHTESQAQEKKTEKETSKNINKKALY